LPVSDNISLHAARGVLFPDVRARNAVPVFRPKAAGLMHLARSDGILWAAAGIFVIALQSRRKGAGAAVALMTSFTAGYLVTMGPWLARNLLIFGSPLPPGSSHVLWLTQYYDTFAYPATRLTWQSWLASGWEAILAARFSALRSNSLETIFQMGGFAALHHPRWLVHRRTRVQPAC
jgi:hypothetical protein